MLNLSSCSWHLEDDNEVRGECRVQRGWLGAWAGELSLKVECHVHLGVRTRPHVELLRTGASQLEEEGRRCIVGSVDVENKENGFPGLTLRLIAVGLKQGTYPL